MNRTKLLPVFLFLLLLACQMPNVAGLPFSPTSTPTATLAPTLTVAPTITATATETSAPTVTSTPAPLARRVLILSIDGLRPEIISLAPMSNLLALMQNSAYTLSAQTVYPSVTLVSHSSMLTGLCPSKHGVDWNDYIPEKGIAQGVDLFDIAHAAGFQTVMHVGKEKLRQITDPSSLDIFTYVNDRDLVVAKRLIADFPENFGVMFVHFPLVDGMGHAFGWLSSPQLSVAYRADEALGLEYSLWQKILMCCDRCRTCGICGRDPCRATETESCNRRQAMDGRRVFERGVYPIQVAAQECRSGSHPARTRQGFWLLLR
jgi:hypothetical protein